MVPIIYINLERSVGRRNFFETQMAKYGLHAQRFEAISEIPEWAGVPIHNMTREELGCTLSHLRCIWELSKSDVEYALICEDDADFRFFDRWPLSLQQMAQQAGDFDMLKLWHFGVFSKPLTFERPACEWGTTAYLISRKGIVSISEQYFEEGVLKQIPLTVADALLNSNVKVCSMPLIVPYNNFEEMNSTIHTDHTALHLSHVERAVDSWASV